MIKPSQHYQNLQRFKSLLICRWFNLKGVLQLHNQLRSLHSQTISGIEHALKTGRFHSTWIYLQSLSEFVKFGQNYEERGCKSSNEVIAEAKKILIEGESHTEVALSTGRPLLMVTIHMGDFQLGFLRLMEHFRPARKTFLFKLNSGDHKEAALMTAFEEIIAAPTVLRMNESGGKAAYLALRQSHIVVMAIDLELQVNSRSVVDFFGKPCHMQNGPATIATLSKALVVPVVTFKNDKGQNVVRIEPFIDSGANVEGETTQQRIDNITQQIAKCMQQWLINWPEQAHSWTSIADTMACPLPNPKLCGDRISI